MIWVLQFASPIIGTLTVVIVVGLSVLGLIGFRRVVSHTRLENANVVSGQVFQLAGVLYAVLVAFVVVVVWEQWKDAEGAAQAEASAIADLMRDSQALPIEARPGLQASLIAYAQDVADEEFPRMRRGEAIEEQSDHLTAVWDLYLQVQPVTRNEIAFFDEAIGRLNELGSSRKVRISSSQSEIPAELWVLLIGGGAIVMAFTYLFGTPDVLLHASVVALTAALMAFVMYLIFALEHPFVGTLSVPPDAYLHVLELWSPHEPG
jgi:Protein of unknown function (DUF4239)